ncbi:MAG: hypothetical protein E4H35_01480 [Candidatus Aminicenantes bacterium]|nr:MAG: hypothetical protein E4H35_01480 [Candidatus Aminicenantes bacterium]
MKIRHLIWLVTLAAVAGCATKYTIVPPAVDLTGYETVGLVTFKVENAKGDLDSLATQLFLQEVTAAQRVPVVELGQSDEVLAGIGKTAFNRDAALAIGEKHGVEAFFLGEIKISKVKPQVDLLAPLSKALFVRAKFDIAVTARLVSAANGATLWTQSSVREGTVGALGMGADGVPTFGMQDKNETMNNLLREMMFRMTWEFRPSRRRL